MKMTQYCLYCGWLVSCLATSMQALAAEPPPIKIMLLGVDHLQQLYNDVPNSAADMYAPLRQQQLSQLRADLAKFAPQQLMVEVDTREQSWLSQQYREYRAGKLAIRDQPFGRSELYQLGFKLAQRLRLPDIFAINDYDDWPQTAIAKGEHHDIYKHALQQLRHTVRPLQQQLKSGKLSLYDYTVIMNEPQAIRFTHRIVFNLPAYVQDGEWTASAAKKAQHAFWSEHYIGADYVARYYGRNLRIYSNILNSQLTTHSQRVLVIIGQLHVGVLAELLADNPRYQLVSPLQYLTPVANEPSFPALLTSAAQTSPH